MASTGTRRGGPRRLLAIFALSVFVPALALAVLAYQSVAKENRALTAERESGFRRAAWLLRKELLEAVTELQKAEEERPYYQYNRWFYEPTQQGEGVNYIRSPIADLPPNPLIAAYFYINPEMEFFSPNDAPVQSDTPQGAQAEAGKIPQLAQETLDGLKGNFLQQLKDNRALLPEAQKRAKFPGVVDRNKQQWVSRKTVAASTQTRQKVQALNKGQEVYDSGRPDFDAEILEIVVSPFLYQDDPDVGLIAFRYVDVPNEGKAFGGRPFLRYVQGFRIDEDYLTGVLFPRFVERYLDIPGGRAGLLKGDDPLPEGQVVFLDDLEPLPGYRLVVTDADRGWVRRRVNKLATFLIAIAAGLLLVIVGGLFFTLRTVREEVGFARRKSDFVASVTHELRTPLTGIKMYADLLKEGWVKDEATRAEYTEFMAAEADRLTRLVNRVLDFARSERGETRSVGPVDLRVPLREVERSFGPYIREKGFALVIRAADTRPALADLDAVKQILLNLLENAVKYAAESDPKEITVRLEEEGSHVVLSVEDHGPGVPREERERVFEDFYRPGEELTRETTGAGLGLALVRRLAESMDGKVELRETPGGGATLSVLFEPADSDG